MRFAHLSDIHLGFQKREPLQEIEQKVFEDSLDLCIEKKVDFVLIAGDMFHVNIPEMRVQKYAFEKFREVHDAGIPVYVVYGSHDFSPVSNSVIDLLVSTGYVTKVTRASESEKVNLEFFTDSKTGAKICGLSGLKAGKDEEYYEKLDRVPLESEPGFKIFLFHGSVTEMRSGPEDAGDHMPLSMLPKGFAYYAGGHLHTCRDKEFDGYPHIVYPGTLFAGHYPDLAANAQGQRRGFYMVEFEDVVTDVSFVEIKNAEYEYIEVKGDERNATSVDGELKKRAQEIDPAGKVIIIDLHGEMTAGKTSDVQSSEVAESLYERGAISVEISRNRLVSKEYSITPAKGKNREEVEGNVFAENIGQLRFKDSRLVGESGVNLAKKLLARIGQPKIENETKSVYQSRMTADGLGEMGLDDS